jgi:hypothetical protein
VGRIARNLSPLNVLKYPQLGDTGKEVRDAMLEEFDKFDKHFPDGVFVEPKETKEPKVRFRALSKYCAEHKKDPEDLTDEEREQFIIHE